MVATWLGGWVARWLGGWAAGPTWLGGCEHVITTLFTMFQCLKLGKIGGTRRKAHTKHLACMGETCSHSLGQPKLPPPPKRAPEKNVADDGQQKRVLQG